MTKIEALNINHPGKSRKVDAATYDLVRQAYLAVVPSEPPGITIREAERLLEGRLPDNLFGDGAQRGWWAKTVQLDLEARELIVRSNETPLKLKRTK